MPSPRYPTVPSTRITSMSTHANTGLWTQILANHCTASSSLARRRLPVLELRSVSLHDLLTERDAAPDGDAVADGGRRLEHALLERAVFDDEDVRLAVRLERRGLRHRRQRLFSDRELYLGEHAGQKPLVGIFHERLDEHVARLAHR